jgi:hypothetical protein
MAPTEKPDLPEIATTADDKSAGYTLDDYLEDILDYPEDWAD